MVVQPIWPTLYLARISYGAGAADASSFRSRPGSLSAAAGRVARATREPQDFSFAARLTDEEPASFGNVTAIAVSNPPPPSTALLPPQSSGT